MTVSQDTPMMRQFKAIKVHHQDAILFFRLGDFYEMFLDDAITASKELDLTLTGRGKDETRIPMCGIPYHAADNYIPRLVSKGYKVAICEQVEEATGKGITKREVVKIITPGTLSVAGQIKDEDNMYLAALHPLENGYGISYVDISTGEFKGLTLKSDLEVTALLHKLSIKEILTTQDLPLSLPDNCLVNQTSFFSQDTAHTVLLQFFNLNSLSSFGITPTDPFLSACAALLTYLKDTQKHALSQLTQLLPVINNDTLYMDPVTLKNLELVENSRDGSKKNTLFSVLNFTKTAMGARFLKQAIQSPLTNVAVINNRLDAVSSLVDDLLSREELRDNLAQVYDLERLVSRIVSGAQTPRDLVALRGSLLALEECGAIISHLSGDIFTRYTTYFNEFSDPASPFQQVVTLIESAIVDTPPITLKDGGVIASGFDTELDMLRDSFKEVKTWITTLEKIEREKTGIKSLKVGFNKVFGYYIEVSNSQTAFVPDTYIRKQTLTNGERYITPELKEKETILLTGEAESQTLEVDIYRRVVETVSTHRVALQHLANKVATLDFLQALATASQKNGYTRPQFVSDDKKTFSVNKGRHPVLEKDPNLTFIPNDINLQKDDTEFMLITGPNMAGKSTLMRQMALIIILAQTGCFVPADSCLMSCVDKLFTRIGATDNLSQGQSTYMVEMVETAHILNLATDKSFILLDEIGRGTATYDGLSIAWAITEYIHSVIQARTLFATHYHELTVLENQLSSLKNFTMKITEHNDTIVFNYLFVRGAADKSYGVHVAKMAGLPLQIIQKAESLLERFEDEGLGYIKTPKSTNQLALF